MSRPILIITHTDKDRELGIYHQLTHLVPIFNIRVYHYDGFHLGAAAEKNSAVAAAAANTKKSVIIHQWWDRVEASFGDTMKIAEQLRRDIGQLYESLMGILNYSLDSIRDDDETTYKWYCSDKNVLNDARRQKKLLEQRLGIPNTTPRRWIDNAILHFLCAEPPLSGWWRHQPLVWIKIVVFVEYFLLNDGVKKLPKPRSDIVAESIPASIDKFWKLTEQEYVPAERRAELRLNHSIDTAASDECVHPPIQDPWLLSNGGYGHTHMPRPMTLAIAHSRPDHYFPYILNVTNSVAEWMSEEDSDTEKSINAQQLAVRLNNSLVECMWEDGDDLDFTLGMTPVTTWANMKQFAYYHLAFGTKEYTGRYLRIAELFYWADMFFVGGERYPRLVFANSTAAPTFPYFRPPFDDPALNTYTKLRERLSPERMRQLMELPQSNYNGNGGDDDDDDHCEQIIVQFPRKEATRLSTFFKAKESFDRASKNVHEDDSPWIPLILGFDHNPELMRRLANYYFASDWQVMPVFSKEEKTQLANIADYYGIESLI